MTFCSNSEGVIHGRFWNFREEKNLEREVNFFEKVFEKSHKVYNTFQTSEKVVYCTISMNRARDELLTIKTKTIYEYIYKLTASVGAP